MRIVYPNPRGVQVVDQYTLARLPYVASLDGAVSANLFTSATIHGKSTISPTIGGLMTTQPQRA